MSFLNIRTMVCRAILRRANRESIKDSKANSSLIMRNPKREHNQGVTRISITRII